MTDDLREALKAAGVDVVDFDLVGAGLIPHRIVDKRDDCPQCALARIARLVVKQQAELDDRTERVKQAIERSRVTAVSPQDVLDLIDRVALMQDDEKRDAYLAAKYKWQRDEAIEDGPGYYPRDALDRRWEEQLKRWQV